MSPLWGAGGGTWAIQTVFYSQGPDLSLKAQLAVEAPRVINHHRSWSGKWAAITYLVPRGVGSGCDLKIICRPCIPWGTGISESSCLAWGDFLVHLHFKMSLLPPCCWLLMFIFNLHVIKMNQSSFHQLQMGLIGVLGFRFLCCFFFRGPPCSWLDESLGSVSLPVLLLEPAGGDRGDSWSCLNVLPPTSSPPLGTSMLLQTLYLSLWNKS